MATEFLSTPTIQRYFFTVHPGLRTVTDATTATTTALISVSAAFSASDVGAAVSGTGITPGTTIASVTDSSHAVMSAVGTIANTNVTVTITRTNTLGLSSFQTAVNADFASVFSPVPTLVTQPAAPSVALLIVSPTQVLSISPGQYVGYNYGNWQVLPASAMNGSLFTQTNV